MTIQQVASKVATIRATNNTLVSDLAPCGLETSLAQAVTCGLIVQRAPLEGQIALKTLAIKDAPAELAELLTTTRTSATTLSKVSSKACQNNSESIDCAVEAFHARAAATNFQLQLAGWEPYL
jgi:hypothetical protein